MSQRKIIQGIRHNKTSYGPGQENDLLAIATPEQLKDWHKRGLIQGDWGVEFEPEALLAEGSSNRASDDVLEPIAARISATLGVERSSEQTPLQFLERFAEECEEAIERIHQRSDALERERDEAKAHREEAVSENDKLKAELEEVKAQLAAASQTTPETTDTKGTEGKSDAKPDAKGKAKS